MAKQMTKTRGSGQGSAQGTGSAANAITTKEIFGIVRRRMWLIIIITCICLIAGLGLFFIMLRTHSKYTSRALIRCKTPVQEDLLMGGALIPQVQLLEVQTQKTAARLLNEYFMSEVLKRTNVQQTKWFQKSADDPEERMEQLKDNFGASPQRNSDLVVVSMSAGSPEEAKLLLEEILRQFSNDMQEEATAELRSELTGLSEQRDLLITERQNLQDKMMELARRANVPGWEQREMVVTEELSVLNMEKMRLEALWKELNIHAQTQREERAQFGTTSEVQQMIEEDAMCMQCKYRIMSWSEERTRLLEKFGEDHDEVKAIDARIQSLQDQQRTRESEIQRQYSQMESQGVEKQIRLVQHEWESISAQYDEVAARQSDLDQQMVKYQNMHSDLEILDKRLSMFEERISSTKVKMDNPQRVRAVVAAPPVQPLRRSFPRLPLFIAASIFIGLLLSGGTVFLIEFLDDSVKSPADIIRQLGTAPLGMIPIYDEEDADDIVLQKVVNERPHAIISEYYRQLRTDLAFIAPEGELKTLFVTSSGAGCGKTMTAVNIALILAFEGKRVLLVDANFRRPLIHRLFAQDSSQVGLSNILVGKAVAEDTIRSGSVNGLDVLDSGPLPPNPADLLNSKQMREFLAIHREKYDFVIIDGPPALLVSDARVMCAVVDGTIVVVRAGVTSRGVLHRLLRELKSTNGRVLGVLLNGVRPLKGGYYQKNYDLYYDYVGADSRTVPTA